MKLHTWQERVTHAKHDALPVSTKQAHPQMNCSRFLITLLVLLVIKDAILADCGIGLKRARSRTLKKKVAPKKCAKTAKHIVVLEPKLVLGDIPEPTFLHSPFPPSPLSSSPSPPSLSSSSSASASLSPEEVCIPEVQPEFVTPMAKLKGQKILYGINRLIFNNGVERTFYGTKRLHHPPGDGKHASIFDYLCADLDTLTRLKPDEYYDLLANLIDYDASLNASNQAKYGREKAILLLIYHMFAEKHGETELAKNYLYFFDHCTAEMLNIALGKELSNILFEGQEAGFMESMANYMVVRFLSGIWVK